MSEEFNLDEMRSSLDGLALELLGGMFPGVDVDAYYRAAEEYVEGCLERDPDYRRFAEGGGPVEGLVYTSMEKVASAYVLITGRRDRERVERVLRNYEVMVGDYMEAEGLLTRVMGYVLRKAGGRG